MNKTTIELKLPKKWAKKIIELADKNNQLVDELILEILAKYLDIDYGKFEGKQIRKEIDILNTKIDQLQERDYQFQKVTTKLNMLEKLIASLQSQVMHSQPLNKTPIIHDDIEDEPDEILTDFLPK